MVRGWYPGGEQPVTQTPVAVPVSADHDGTARAESSLISGPGPLHLVVQSGTQGASVETRLEGGAWRLTTAPLRFERGEHKLEARAVRYGFAPSEVATWRIAAN